MQAELNFDVTTVGGLGLVAMAFLSSLKLLFPKAIANREPLIAVVLGLGLAFGAKLAGTIAFKAGYAGWLQTIGAGLAVAVAAGVGHDYALNPIKAATSSLKGFIGSLFGKKKEDPNAPTANDPKP